MKTENLPYRRALVAQLVAMAQKMVHLTTSEPERQYEWQQKLQARRRQLAQIDDMVGKAKVKSENLKVSKEQDSSVG